MIKRSLRVTDVARTWMVGTSPAMTWNRAERPCSRRKVTRSGNSVINLPTSPLVMPGLVPGIHVLGPATKDVDGRDKPGHDAWNFQTATTRTAPSRRSEAIHRETKQKAGSLRCAREDGSWLSHTAALSRRDAPIGRQV